MYDFALNEKFGADGLPVFCEIVSRTDIYDVAAHCRVCVTLPPQLNF